MSIVYVLLVAHFVGDFLCQSDWMAVNKSKRWDALGVHVWVYGMVVGLCVIPWWTPHRFGTFVLVNMAAHFVTDAITSRITSRLWFFAMEPGIWAQAEYTVPRHGRTLVNPWTPIADNRHWFFVAIGADQLIHFVTLVATASWWLS